MKRNPIVKRLRTTVIRKCLDMFVCLFMNKIPSTLTLIANGTFPSPIALKRAEKWIIQSIWYDTTICWSPLKSRTSAKRNGPNVFNDQYYHHFFRSYLPKWKRWCVLLIKINIFKFLNAPTFSLWRKIFGINMLISGGKTKECFNKKMSLITVSVSKRRNKSFGEILLFW